MKLKPTMKKAFLLFFLIINCYWGNAQTSSIVLNIKDVSERYFLSDVENRLLQHLDAIQKHKKKCDVDLCPINPHGWGWHFPMSLMEIEMDTPPNEKIRTEEYKLDFQWNNSLDTAYVIGFSRVYEYKKYDSTIEYSPIYDMPLNKYNTFLTNDEMKRLSSIIQFEFVRYFNEDTIYNHDKETSRRVIVFNKSDSLSQLPWNYWVEIMTSEIKQSGLHVYSNPSCQYLVDRSAIDRDFVYSYTIGDSTGNSHNIQRNNDFTYIKVAEKWSFDTIKRSNVMYQRFYLTISRKVESIGLTPPPVPADADKFNYFTMWLKNDEIERICKHYGGELYLYEDLINSALYRKLNLSYK
jgi:hypothetical protein